MRGHLLVFNNGGRYCCGGQWRRDFSVQHADERSSSASAIVAASTLRTPWDEPDLQGIWTDAFDTPFQRLARFANQEYYTEGQREELDKERSSVLSNQ